MYLLKNASRKQEVSLYQRSKGTKLNVSAQAQHSTMILMALLSVMIEGYCRGMMTAMYRSMVTPNRLVTDVSKEVITVPVLRKHIMVLQKQSSCVCIYIKIYKVI